MRPYLTTCLLAYSLLDKERTVISVNPRLSASTNLPGTRLLIATTNPGKIKEYQSLLEGVPLEIIGLHEVGITAEVDETGATFEENALLKARAYAQASGLLTLADDSGLCVDALGGAPGVLSARYAAGDRARIERLLAEMDRVPDDQRAARFVCVIALASPEGEAQTFEGVCEGRIARQPSGTNGFGFDPIFFLPEPGRTMADLPMPVKNQISHRARAAAQARAWLLGGHGGVGMGMPTY